MILLCNPFDYIQFPGIIKLVTPVSVSSDYHRNDFFFNVYKDETDENKLHIDICRMTTTEKNTSVINTDAEYYLNLDDENIKSGIIYNAVVPRKLLPYSENLANYIYQTENTKLKIDYLNACFNSSYRRIQLYRRISDKELFIFFHNNTFFSELFFTPDSTTLWTVVKENDPHFKDKNKEIKTKLLYELDANDSLSYVDVQLDFITTILFKILERNPELEAEIIDTFKQYANYKSIALENSVFNRKTEEDIITSFNEKKSHVHNTLLKYYESTKE